MYSPDQEEQRMKLKPKIQKEPSPAPQWEAGRPTPSANHYSTTTSRIQANRCYRCQVTTNTNAAVLQAKHATHLQAREQEHAISDTVQD